MFNFVLFNTDAVASRLLVFNEAMRPPQGIAVTCGWNKLVTKHSDEKKAKINKIYYDTRKEWICFDPYKLPQKFSLCVYDYKN